MSLSDALRKRDCCPDFCHTVNSDQCSEHLYLNLFYHEHCAFLGLATYKKVSALQRQVRRMSDADGPAAGSAPRNRACDFCFSKKIKCDREDPCANCLAAPADCLRKRPRRRIKHSVRDRYRSDTLHRRSHQSSSPLSPTWRNHPPPPRRTGQNPTKALQGDLPTVERNQQPDDLVLVIEGEPGPATTPSSKNGGDSAFSTTTEPGPAASQAHSHIGFELKSRVWIDTGRRDVLKAALDFAMQASEFQQPASATAEDDTAEKFDMFSETCYPSAETLYLILNMSKTSFTHSFSSTMGSVISEETFQHQGIDLIENKVAGAARLHYMVNVNFFVWMLLGGSDPKGVASGMRRHLAKKRLQYENNLQSALYRIGVLDTPSMALFQALLSGAKFMLLSGKLEKCWQLCTAASRVCMALGGPRQICSQATGDHDSREVRHTLSVCFVFDRALALSMNRTTSLPEFHMKPEELSLPDTSRPYYTLIIQVFLHLAEVQGDIVRESKVTVESRNINAIQGLQNRMWKIKESMVQFSHVTEKYFQAELMGLEFVYNSVMTSILKLHPNVMEDGRLNQQLLGYARMSLRCLLDMMSHAEKLVEFNVFRDAVLWVILLYPLYPFFVLFTHAVNLSSIQDYQMISEVTQNLQSFAGQNPALMGVQKLFEGIVNICKTQYEKDHNACPMLAGTSEADAPAAVEQTGSRGQSRAMPRNIPNSKCTSSFSPVGEEVAGPSVSGSPFLHEAAFGDLPASHLLLTLEERNLLATLHSTQPSIGWIDGNWFLE